MKRYDINEFRAKDWYRLGEESQGVRKQIKYFKNAVALDPLHGPAWHYLGVLYSRKGDKKTERFCNEKPWRHTRQDSSDTKENSPDRNGKIGTNPKKTIRSEEHTSELQSH